MTPLQKLLNHRLTCLGWRVTDLHRAVAAAGIGVTFQAVYLWLNGGGIADRHKPAVALALGIPLGDLAAAAAGCEPTLSA